MILQTIGRCRERRGGGLVAESCPTLVTPWVVACQPPLSSAKGFSRQEYCRGLPFPSPGDLPDPGIKPGCPVSPARQEDSLPTVTREALREEEREDVETEPEKKLRAGRVRRG